MYQDSPTRPPRTSSRETKSLYAYQVLFALHCLGFLGLLVARDADKPLRSLVEGLALGGPGSFWESPWQLVTYAFVHQHPLEITISVAFLLALGGPVERALGSFRFVALYLGATALVALGYEGVEALWMEPAGEATKLVFLGGLGGSAALVSAYSLAFPTKRTLGIMPAPIFFCAGAVFLLATLTYLEEEPVRKLVELIESGLSNDQWLDRQLEQGAHPATAIPHALGFLAGASVFAVDAAAALAFQRARLRRDIRILEEQLEARARVEQLLEKISREGLDALSRRERKFLQYASRFYPTGDRVTSEGP